MSYSVRLMAEPLRSLAHGSIGATYAGVGTAIENPVRILLVKNLTDKSLMFSLNGVDDTFPLGTGESLLLNITANKTTPSGLFIAEGTRIYVKEIVSPTSGAAYVTVFYGYNN